MPKVRSTKDVPTVSVTSQTHRSEAFQIVLLAGLDNLHARNHLLSLLQQFDEDVQGIEVMAPKGIRVWHKKTGPTPISVFGDGFRRVLTYALALFRCRDGGVLLIDEMETAIHYSALREVYTWLVRSCEQYDVQLFVTTHSLEAIDALLDATPEKLDTSYFRLFDIGQGPRVIRFSENLFSPFTFEGLAFVVNGGFMPDHRWPVHTKCGLRYVEGWVSTHPGVTRGRTVRVMRRSR